MLYISYVLMYRLLKIVQAVNPSSDNFGCAIRLFESAGFNSVRIPDFMAYWLDGIGTFTDPDSGRDFLPKLPAISKEGIYHDNYFFSPDVAHLLPNFKLMQLLTLLSSEGFDKSRIVDQLAQAQANKSRIPGAEQCMAISRDDDLTDTIYAAYQQEQVDPLMRYLSVSHGLLSHLHSDNISFFRSVESVSLASFGEVGNCLVMYPMIHVSASEQNPESMLDFRTVIKTRTVTDICLIRIAAQTPIVRITSSEDQRIVIDNASTSDPNHSWFSGSMELSTSPISLLEAHSYFQLKP